MLSPAAGAAVGTAAVGDGPAGFAYSGPMGLLDGRVAVVTGAGRGIGRAIALCLADEGARVVVNDIGVALGGEGTEEDPAEQVCARSRPGAVPRWPVATAVDDFDAAGRIIGTAVDPSGKIDILVNNAGIVRDRTLVKMDEGDYDAVVAVHQKGTFNTARHAAPLMKEAGYGRIVNITSSAGLRGNFGQTNYGAAKAAIMGMTFVWAVELGRYGITVNAMAPAGATRMTQGLAERRRPRRSGSRPQRAAGGLSWPRRPPPTSTGRSSGAPASATPSSRRRGRWPPCGRRGAGRPPRWPSTSTRCWASTSSRWGCPPTRCSATRRSR